MSKTRAEKREEMREQAEYEDRALDWCLREIGMTRDQITAEIREHLKDKLDDPVAGMGSSTDHRLMIWRHPKTAGTNAANWSGRAIQNIQIRLHAQMRRERAQAMPDQDAPEQLTLL